MQPRPQRKHSPLVQQLVPLSRRDQVCSNPSVRRTRPTRADARARSGKSATSQHRPSLSVQRLAAELVAISPNLRGSHIGSLCRALESLGIDDTGWTGADIMQLLTRHNQERSLFEPLIARNPIGLFLHQMRQVLSHVSETPKQRRTQEQAAERARRLARAEELAAEQARRRQLEQPERQARIRGIVATGRERLRSATESARVAARRAELAGEKDAAVDHSGQVSERWVQVQAAVERDAELQRERRSRLGATS